MNDLSFRRPSNGDQPWHLAEGEILVGWLDLQPFQDNWSRFLPVLSADEQARAARYTFERSRRQFVSSRVGLRVFLGQILGRSPAAVQFSYGTHGKPALIGTGDDLLGISLSHTGDTAVYVASWDRELGIDIEVAKPRQNAGGLVERFFSSAEQAEWRDTLPEHQLAAFYQGWTGKEAYLKARGTGLNFPLSQFSVRLSPLAPPALLEVEGEPHEVRRWSMNVLTADSGVAGTLAFDRAPGSMRQWRLNRELIETAVEESLRLWG